MSKFLKNLVLLLLPVLTLAIGVQLGMHYEQQREQTDLGMLDEIIAGEVGSGQLLYEPEEEVDLTLLWSVWKLVLKHYIKPEELQSTAMFHGAIEGMVAAIDDPYTTFMPPKENKDFRASLDGKLQGIGAELMLKDGKTIVVAPLKGSPAEDAGLLPKDTITHVDDEAIDSWSLGEVVDVIRGPQGTQVTLTVEREDIATPVTITITREQIKIPSTEAETKEYDGKTIGYISINRFGDQTGTDVGAHVKEFVEAGVDGIILDVRFNGGGYLDKAVELSSMFMKKGKVVSVARRSGEPTAHYVSGTTIAADMPLVVLINEGSASASEILAGALQDGGRATIIGMKSFGKGTVQEVFQLPGNTSVRITTARWLTPSGRDLGEEGIQPDIEVDRTREQIENEEDPQLDAALENLSGGA